MTEPRHYAPRHLTVYRAPDKPRGQGRSKLAGPASLYRMTDEEREARVWRPGQKYQPKSEATK